MIELTRKAFFFLCAVRANVVYRNILVAMETVFTSSHSEQRS